MKGKLVKYYHIRERFTYILKVEAGQKRATYTHDIISFDWLKVVDRLKIRELHDNCVK